MWQDAAQRAEQRPIGGPQRWSMDLAAKDPEFMAQHQDLDLFGVLGAKHPHEEFDEADQRRVRKRPQHRDVILQDPPRTESWTLTTQASSRTCSPTGGSSF